MDGAEALKASLNGSKTLVRRTRTVRTITTVVGVNKTTVTEEIETTVDDSEMSKEAKEALSDFDSIMNKFVKNMNNFFGVR